MWSYSDIQWQPGMLFENIYSKDNNTNIWTVNSRDEFPLKKKKNLWPLQLHLVEELKDILVVFLLCKLTQQTK